jgi:hypothetical protein
MARRRDARPVPPPLVGRPFAADELAEIRHLIATWHAPGVHQHPHPYVDRLEEIHAAAGRRRGLKVWELGRITTADDYDRAIAEETHMSTDTAHDHKETPA